MVQCCWDAVHHSWGGMWWRIGREEPRQQGLLDDVAWNNVGAVELRAIQWSIVNHNTSCQGTEAAIAKACDIAVSEIPP